MPWAVVWRPKIREDNVHVERSLVMEIYSQVGIMNTDDV